MNDQKLNTIINQIDQGKIPHINTNEEQKHLDLIMDLKSSNSHQMEPDPDFINKLETKLLKKSQSPMKTFWEKINKKQYLVGFAVVVVLFIGLNGGLYLPSPIDLINSKNLISRNSMNNSIAIDNPQMGRNSVGMVESSPMKKMIPDMNAGNMGAPEPYVDSYYQPYDEDILTTDRSVVQSADLNIKAKDVSGTIDEAVAYVESVNGYVTNSSMNKTDRGYRASISVRVPSDTFQATVQNFRRMAVEVVYENVNSYDQTRQVVNTEDRLKDLNQQKEKYELLLDEATDSKEILRIQQQIDNIERQIKNIQRQAESLKAQEKMSSIHLGIEEDRFEIPFVNQWMFQDAVQSLKKLVAFFFVLGVWGVVFAPIWLPALLISKWLKKRKKNK